MLMTPGESSPLYSPLLPQPGLPPPCARPPPLAPAAGRRLWRKPASQAAAAGPGVVAGTDTNYFLME